MTKKEFITKDSGKRVDFSSGMRRDTQEDKPRFDLLLGEDQKYDETLIKRWADLMGRGAEKYGERNGEKANSVEELKRFKASFFRHAMQLLSGDTSEDHFAACCFNLNAIVMLMNKLNCDINGNKLKK